MANQLTLTNTSLSTSTAITLLDSEFNYGWRNMNKADPFVSGFGDVEIIHSGWENPIINLTFLIPVDNIPANTMTWALWNELVKAQVTSPTTKTYMSVIVGDTNTVFSDYSQSSSSVGTSTIPVRVNSFDLKFSPSYSKNANLWTVQAKLQVDKS